MLCAETLAKIDLIGGWDNVQITSVIAERDKPAEEPKPAPVQEARVEEKPKTEELDQEPLVVAQELGMQQADREMV